MNSAKSFENFLFIYLILINVLGFIIFYIDKRRARNKEWRVTESFLFGVAILGGALGSTLGMKTFHHKTKKKRFTIGLPLIFIFNIVFFMSIKEIF